MKNKCYAITEIAGCGVIGVAAILLRYLFRWFGPGALTIVFGSVNGSVWEEIKVFSGAYIGYGLFELLWIRVGFRRYVAAKCAGLYGLMGGIIAFHYIAVWLFPTAAQKAEPIAAIIIVGIAQLLASKLVLSDLTPEDYFAPAVFLLMLYYLMFFSFTIYPPKAELFRDPASGGFGYLENAVEKH